MGDRLASIRAAVTSLLVMVTLAIILLVIVAAVILAIGVIWGRLFARGVEPWLVGQPAIVGSFVAVRYVRR